MFANAGAAGTTVYPPLREIYSTASAPDPLKKRTPTICSNLGSRMGHSREIAIAPPTFCRKSSDKFSPSLAQANRRLPSHDLLNTGVIAVPTLHAFWRAQIVSALESHAGDLFHDVHQLVNCYKFVASNVERSRYVTADHQARAFDAVVNVDKTARLMAVAPDFNFMFSGKLGRYDLATNGRGRLLPTAIKGTVWTIDIVVASDARVQSEIFPKMPAHPLAKELLPSIPVLWSCGICVFFFQGGNVRISLLIGSVDARTAGKQIFLHPDLARSHQEMRVDQDAEHTKRFVMLDEADPAHVRCEVVNFAHAAGHSSLAGSAILQVKCQVLSIFKTLIPLVERLDIDRAN